ncbi:MAG: hydroxyacid dehydrogenase [Anaerolineae bacterium]|nr:hydroxyacid dehydrogenase [Anaerolineae bacterium]
MTTNVHILISTHAHFIFDRSDEADRVLKEQLDPTIHLTQGEVVPPETEILVGGRPSREQLASPKLKALIIPWAGLPDETKAILPEFPHISVHNLHHNAAPVAETAVTLLLAAAKLTIRYDRSLRRHDWRIRYEPSPTLTLEGRTALILGYGAIGQRVARACRALGMDVLATRRSETSITTDDYAEIHPSSALPDLLPRTHALIICLPLTAETEGLISKTELNALQPHAILVNVGRGPIVDEQALYDALVDGTLHAAGLDVWFNYPPDEAARAYTPATNVPLHELDNIVMSPHRAGLTRDTDRLRMTHLAALLNHAAQGKPLPNRLDLERGY